MGVTEPLCILLTIFISMTCDYWIRMTYVDRWPFLAFHTVPLKRFVPSSVCTGVRPLCNAPASPVVQFTWLLWHLWSKWLFIVLWAREQPSIVFMGACWGVVWLGELAWYIWRCHDSLWYYSVWSQWHQRLDHRETMQIWILHYTQYDWLWYEIFLVDV